MSVIFMRELNYLHQEVLKLAEVVEQRVFDSVKSIQRWDATLARKVMDGDNEIDLMELDVEEECLKILALHQPVAQDLRYIVAVLKINNDLERIGDLAANIAAKALVLMEYERDAFIDLSGMCSKVQWMLKQSLDAMVQQNSALARQVLSADKEIDAAHQQNFERIVEEVETHPHKVRACMSLLGVSKHLERIADHATNIAEDVVYTIEGEVLRHLQGKLKGQEKIK
jgi:phosphate transport system protein